jgi:hypothetical protein
MPSVERDRGANEVLADTFEKEVEANGSTPTVPSPGGRR